MSHALNTPILLLREGTDISQGKPQIISNINACAAVADVLRTTLGPCGMDKMLVSDHNDAIISNDGATLISNLDVVHPAALCLVDVAKAQDDEVGDGTTSVVLLAGELLNEAKILIERDIPPQIIIKAYKTAVKLAISHIAELKKDLSAMSKEEKQLLLARCAMTSLNSKMICSYKEFFADIAVSAVLTLGDALDKDMIGIKKVTGGSCTDTQLVKGVAFKKTFSYAGFEQQPKLLLNPKILLLNLELELKAEKENAEIRLTKFSEYQKIVDAEWRLIFDKLDIITSQGAKVVLSKLPIGDLATQYFADRGIFCAGRVDESDLKRTAMATGSTIQSTVNGLSPSAFGTCDRFEEMQVGAERFNIFQCGDKSKSATIILRGGAMQFVDEAERSLNDAVMIVKRAIKTHTIVGGGGAIEMQLSRYLLEYSRGICGRQQFIIAAFARALECIPKALTHNSGHDATDMLNLLRQRHFQAAAGDSKWFGVDCVNGGVVDTMETYVWEPSLVKSHALSAATEAACLVLSIDETVKSQPSGAGR